MNDTEVVQQRRQTAAFIGAESVIIRFERKIMRRNGRGGQEPFTVGWTQPQRVRFVRGVLKRNREALEATSAGTMKRCYDRLICPHDADIQAGDHFDFEGEQWVVQKILPRLYEIVADVELRGVDPNA